MQQGICTNQDCESAKNKVVQDCDVENGQPFECQSCLLPLKPYIEPKNPFKPIVSFFKGLINPIVVFFKYLNPAIFKYAGMALGGVFILALIIWGASKLFTPGTDTPTVVITEIKPTFTQGKSEVDSSYAKLQAEYTLIEFKNILEGNEQEQNDAIKDLTKYYLTPDAQITIENTGETLLAKDYLEKLAQYPSNDTSTIAFRSLTPEVNPDDSTAPQFSRLTIIQSFK